VRFHCFPPTAYLPSEILVGQALQAPVFSQTLVDFRQLFYYPHSWRLFWPPGLGFPFQVLHLLRPVGGKPEEQQKAKVKPKMSTSPGQAGFSASSRDAGS
jgi:hypothetical protein